MEYKEVCQYQFLRDKIMNLHGRYLPKKRNKIRRKFSCWDSICRDKDERRFPLVIKENEHKFIIFTNLL